MKSYLCRLKGKEDKIVISRQFLTDFHEVKTKMFVFLLALQWVK